MSSRHEWIDHTGDLALRIHASTLKALYAEAVAALFDSILDVTTVRPVDPVRVKIDGALDPSDLLVRFLSELLFRHDAQGALFREAEIVDLGPDAIEAIARGEPFDPSRHTIERQVKAITYHRARVERTEEGWVAEVVLDL